MIKLRAPLWISASIMAFAATFSVSTQAQDIEGVQAEPIAEDEETTNVIVVTARRKAENLQDVPIAVTAVSGEVFDRRRSDNIADIQSLIPNAVFNPHGGSNNNANVTIRGVGQTDQFFMFDSGVGIYLDDVYLARAQASLLETVDIERVEVLRGPQGTLYGKNTSGGAIKVITRDPLLDRFEGNTTVTFGSFEEGTGRISLNLPIAEDVFAVRATLLARQRSGFVENLDTGEDTFDRDYIGGQITGLLQMSDRLSLRVAVDAMRDRSVPAGVTNVNEINFPPQIAFDPVPARRTRVGITPQNDQDVFGVNATLRWEGDNFELRWINSYRQLEFQDLFDFDGYAFPLIGSDQTQESDQTSSELQMNFGLGNNIDVVAGLYYFNEFTDSFTNVPNNFPVEAAPGFFVFLENNFVQITALTTDSYAAFANFDWRLADRLSLSGGIRYTRDEKDYDASLSNDVFPQSNFAFADVDSWSAWTPRIALDYEFTPEFTAYASYATGFRSGGFNPRAASAEVALPYDTETSETFELGAKTTLFDGRLTWNSAAFYNRFEDYQTNLVTVVGTPPVPTSFFTNAGGFESWGFETEFVAQITDELTVTGQASFFDDQFEEFLDPVVGNFADKSLPNAPRFTAGAAVNYIKPLSDIVDLQIDADVGHQSSSFISILNEPNLRRDANTLINARIALTFKDPGIQVFFGGRNLTDEIVIVDSRIDPNTFGYNINWFNPPRVFYGGVRFDF
ncbi:MAG: TonB-dependent receptor [Pseudomonadota bacterium]